MAAWQAYIKTWPRSGRKGMEGLETGDGFLTFCFHTFPLSRGKGGKAEASGMQDG
jgi:hypothetical protein